MAVLRSIFCVFYFLIYVQKKLDSRFSLVTTHFSHHKFLTRKFSFLSSFDARQQLATFSLITYSLRIVVREIFKYELCRRRFFQGKCHLSAALRLRQECQGAVLFAKLHK